MGKDLPFVSDIKSRPVAFMANPLNIPLEGCPYVWRILLEACLKIAPEERVTLPSVVTFLDTFDDNLQPIGTLTEESLAEVLQIKPNKSEKTALDVTILQDPYFSKAIIQGQSPQALRGLLLRKPITLYNAPIFSLEQLASARCNLCGKEFSVIKNHKHACNYHEKSYVMGGGMNKYLCCQAKNIETKGCLSGYHTDVYYKCKTCGKIFSRSTNRANSCSMHSYSVSSNSLFSILSKPKCYICQTNIELNEGCTKKMEHIPITWKKKVNFISFNIVT